MTSGYCFKTLLLAGASAFVLAACGDRAAPASTTPPALIDMPAATVESPVSTPPRLLAENFITGARGAPIERSTGIIIGDESVTLRFTDDTPSLGLKKVAALTPDQDYLVTVDLEMENPGEETGFRVAAWTLDAEGERIAPDGVQNVGQKYDPAGGRQTLNFRFGPVTGETDALKRLPDVGGSTVRFLLVPMKPRPDSVLTIYDLSVTRD